MHTQGTRPLFYIYARVYLPSYISLSLSIPCVHWSYILSRSRRRERGGRVAPHFRISRVFISPCKRGRNLRSPLFFWYTHTCIIHSRAIFLNVYTMYTSLLFSFVKEEFIFNNNIRTWCPPSCILFIRTYIRPSVGHLRIPFSLLDNPRATMRDTWNSLI